MLCSAANSVSTSLVNAAFGSGPDAKYSKASAFCSFLSTTMVFCGFPNTSSQERHPRVYLNRAAIDNRWISIKISTRFVEITSVAFLRSQWSGVRSSDGGRSVPLFKFLFYLFFATLMRVFSEIFAYRNASYKSGLSLFCFSLFQ